MKMDNIKIIVNDTVYENEPDRMSFLLGYLYSKNKDILDFISEIEDHEGCLIIKWSIPPLPSFRDFCKEAWESPICNECSDNIEHYVGNKRIG